MGGSDNELLDVRAAMRPHDDEIRADIVGELPDLASSLAATDVNPDTVARKAAQLDRLGVDVAPETPGRFVRLIQRCPGLEDVQKMHGAAWDAHRGARCLVKREAARIRVRDVQTDDHDEGSVCLGIDVGHDGAPGGFFRKGLALLRPGQWRPRACSLRGIHRCPPTRKIAVRPPPAPVQTVLSSRRTSH